MSPKQIENMGRKLGGGYLRELAEAVEVEAKAELEAWIADRKNATEVVEKIRTFNYTKVALRRVCDRIAEEI